MTEFHERRRLEHWLKSELKRAMRMITTKDTEGKQSVAAARGLLAAGGVVPSLRFAPLDPSQLVEWARQINPTGAGDPMLIVAGRRVKHFSLERAMFATELVCAVVDVRCRQRVGGVRGGDRWLWPRIHNDLQNALVWV